MIKYAKLLLVGVLCTSGVLFGWTSYKDRQDAQSKDTSELVEIIKQADPKKPNTNELCAVCDELLVHRKEEQNIFVKREKKKKIYKIIPKLDDVTRKQVIEELSILCIRMHMAGEQGRKNLIMLSGGWSEQDVGAK